MRVEIDRAYSVVSFVVYEYDKIRVHQTPCQNKEQAIELENHLKKLVDLQGIKKTENDIFLQGGA